MDVDIERMKFNLTIDEMVINKEVDIVKLFKSRVQEVLSNAKVESLDRVQLAIILLVVEAEIKRTLK